MNACTSCKLTSLLVDDVNLIGLRTFMTLRKPSLFFRGVILGAQGVFWNLFCAIIPCLFFTCTQWLAHKSHRVYLVTSNVPSFCRIPRRRSSADIVGPFSFWPLHRLRHPRSTRIIKELEEGRLPNWYCISLSLSHCD
jgi:hypothetical protein